MKIIPRNKTHKSINHLFSAIKWRHKCILFNAFISLQLRNKNNVLQILFQTSNNQSIHEEEIIKWNSKAYVMEIHC